MKRGSLWSVLGILAIGVGLLALFSLALGGKPADEAQITGLLHLNLAQGVKEFRVSLMNAADEPLFCQGVVNVTRDGVLLKSVKGKGGTMMPGTERLSVIRVHIPEGATATFGTVCV